MTTANASYTDIRTVPRADLERLLVQLHVGGALLGDAAEERRGRRSGLGPVGIGIGELLQSDEDDALARSPYTEWYENSLRFPDSPVSIHHRTVYGDRPYRAFADDWEAGPASWDPEAWAARFAATGARSVVLVAKHLSGTGGPPSAPEPTALLVSPAEALLCCDDSRRELRRTGRS